MQHVVVLYNNNKTKNSFIPNIQSQSILKILQWSLHLFLDELGHFGQ